MHRRSLLAMMGGASLAASFTPAPKALAALTDDKSTRLRARLKGYIRTNWSRDPFSKGSYSYIAKGAKRRDYAALAKPAGARVFFAGEAAHPLRNSTVHAAFESGQRAAAELATSPHQTIAIIGAGMSGLAAAHQLSNSGRKVTVFEARDRIGGRVWTDNRLDMPLDLGASWIHGVTGNPLTTLADAAGQNRIATGEDYITRGRGGRPIADKDVPAWLWTVASVQHNAGADIRELNTKAYLWDEDYTGGDVAFPDGYSPIFDTLKGDYALRLSAIVKSVRTTQNAVTLALAGAGEESFDAVIVTVPLGVLKAGSIAFDPPLPADKQHAINALGMGVLDKVYLLFDAPFWQGDPSWILTPDNGLPRGQFNQWLNLHHYFGAPVIMAFNGGPPAFDLADASDEEILAKALKTLSLAYPA